MGFSITVSFTIAVVTLTIVLGGLTAVALNYLDTLAQRAQAERYSLELDRDSCIAEITGIIDSASPSGVNITITVNNTGNNIWWNPNTTHVVVEIILTNGSTLTQIYRLAELNYSIVNDSFNIGLTDPGETLAIEIHIPGITTAEIKTARAVFSTQYGYTCITPPR